MNLVTKRSINNVPLSYLVREHTPVEGEDFTYVVVTYHVEPNANHRSCNARIGVTLKPIRESSEVMLDIMCPQVEGGRFYIPPFASKLFDNYYDSREKCLASLRAFHATHEEESTTHLKRTGGTKVAEANRVNARLDVNAEVTIEDLKGKALLMYCEAIDSVIDKYNTVTRETLSRYVLNDGIKEEWIVENLYTDVQKAAHADRARQLAILQELINNTKGTRGAIKDEHDRMRRSTVQKALIEWTADIPEIQAFVQEIDLSKAEGKTELAFN